ncbi:hypothetical protein [Desulfurobacterium sp.]
MKRLLTAVIVLSLTHSAAAEIITNKQAQDILLEATYKLVKDVDNVKQDLKKVNKRVDNLEQLVKALKVENEMLKKEIKDIKYELGIKDEFLKKEKFGSRKIIVGTFKKPSQANMFASLFERKFKRAAVVKQTECKRIGACFVVYTVGDSKFLQKVRKKIPDAFFARP